MIVSGVTCDVCGKAWLIKHMAKKYVVPFAREIGWKIGKRCICPMCAQKESGNSGKKRLEE